MNKEDMVCVCVCIYIYIYIYIYICICIYKTEYYLTIKKNEILPFATTWMDLEGIMLSEISQRNTYMWNLKNTTK